MLRKWRPFDTVSVEVAITSKDTMFHTAILVKVVPSQNVPKFVDEIEYIAPNLKRTSKDGYITCMP